MTTSDQPLLVYDGTDGPRTFRLAGGPIQIGRDAQADLTLSDRSLSSRHCRIAACSAGSSAMPEVCAHTRNIGVDNGVTVFIQLVDYVVTYDSRATGNQDLHKLLPRTSGD